MGELQSIPWIVAVFSAAAFAVIAFRAGRSWLVWGLGWGIYGLVLSTWVTGLFVAAYSPVLDKSESALKFKAALVCVILVVIPAAVFLWKLTPQAVDRPVEAPAPK